MPLDIEASLRPVERKTREDKYHAERNEATPQRVRILHKRLLLVMTMCTENERSSGHRGRNTCATVAIERKQCSRGIPRSCRVPGPNRYLRARLNVRGSVFRKGKASLCSPQWEQDQTLPTVATTGAVLGSRSRSWWWVM